ncbi:hypothetical protein Lalb_Chr23g0276631 [Lupinus albus]|uniref:Uncharacterized protein n=1 Tax=Lupinus albus TaxID=3870 RepID=A0A6A4N5Z3_LUPAL|nr:hypothetical protein Lalb_Chr23g0276631 [Lupinus albus]
MRLIDFFITVMGIFLGIYGGGVDFSINVNMINSLHTIFIYHTLHNQTCTTQSNSQV